MRCRDCLAPVVAALGTSLLLAACAGALPPPLSNHAEQAPRPVCTDSEIAVLEEQLGRRWDVGRGLEVRCVGGRFPELGWFVEARWGAVRRVGIVSLDLRREVVPFLELVADRTVRSVTKKLLVADIDSNGIDEVVDAWRHERYGASGDQMIVWTTGDPRGRGSEIGRIDGPNLSAFRPGLGGCRARAEVSDGGVTVIVRTSHGLSPVECLRSGRHRFVIAAGQMVLLERDGDVTLEAPPAPPVTSTLPAIFDRPRS